MVRSISEPLFKGALQVIDRAEERFEEALKGLSPESPISLRDKEGKTIPYSLPVTHGCLGYKVEKLTDLRLPLEKARELVSSAREEESIERFQNVGLATILAAEVTKALEVLSIGQPEVGEGFQFNGPIAEPQLRDWGIKLLDGSIPGLALLFGQAKSKEVVLKLVQELRAKGMLVFLAEQGLAKTLIEEAMELGHESLVIPLGSGVESAAYAFGFATSLALSFGSVKPGDFQNLALYTCSRLPAFCLFLGQMDELKWAIAFGAIAFNLPVLFDTEVPQLPSELAERMLSIPFDGITGGGDDLERTEELVERCLEAGGIKVAVPQKPSLPVAYDPEFEGETVQPKALQVEFRGFEWLTMKSAKEIKDGRVTVIGPEIEDAREEAALGIVVEVAGHRMRKDFEPVLERHIGRFISRAKGIQHTGQRDTTRIRMSKEALGKGFRIEHLGNILHICFRNEFEAIVEKVQVSLYTEEGKVREMMQQAREIYRERDARIAGLSDEMADTYYSCVLCQSINPAHVCIVSPEREGLCGAYNWLDCQAAYEINPAGVNQPVPKGECLDPIKGEWEGVNKFVYENSQRRVERFTLNSLIDAPATVSTATECLTVFLPEVNGVMVIHRDDPSPTPLGMDFNELLSMAIGLQTSGIIGHGKLFLTSRKFIPAEGGIKRVVWMSKNIKEELANELKEAFEREGVPELGDKIADGDIATTIDELLAFLEERKHPALDMSPII